MVVLAAFCLAGVLEATNAAPSVQPLPSGRWPASPRLSGDAVDVKVAGSHAYVALSEAGLAIYDVTDPANAVLVNRWHDTNSVRSVAVSGNYAYSISQAAGSGYRCST
jgi:hypothetical protein